MKPKKFGKRFGIIQLARRLRHAYERSGTAFSLSVIIVDNVQSSLSEDFHFYRNMLGVSTQHGTSRPPVSVRLPVTLYCIETTLRYQRKFFSIWQPHQLQFFKAHLALQNSKWNRSSGKKNSSVRKIRYFQPISLGNGTRHAHGYYGSNQNRSTDRLQYMENIHKMNIEYYGDYITSLTGSHR